MALIYILSRLMDNGLLVKSRNGVITLLKELYLTNKILLVKIIVEERWQSWSIASDLKSDEVQASVGSNPTFSDYI